MGKYAYEILFAVGNFVALILAYCSGEILLALTNGLWVIYWVIWIINKKRRSK